MTCNIWSEIKYAHEIAGLHDCIKVYARVCAEKKKKNTFHFPSNFRFSLRFICFPRMQSRGRNLVIESNAKCLRTHIFFFMKFQHHMRVRIFGQNVTRTRKQNHVRGGFQREILCIELHELFNISRSVFRKKKGGKILVEK